MKLVQYFVTIASINIGLCLNILGLKMANKHIDVKGGSSKSELQSNAQYQTLLQEIKSRLKKAQLRAAVVVNHELIQFYWEVESLIAER